MNVEQPFPEEPKRKIFAFGRVFSACLQTSVLYKKMEKYLRRQLRSQTFAPAFLPASLQKPIAGYLIALISQSLVVVGMTSVMQRFGNFRFLEAPTLLVGLLITLGWGVLPGLLAILIGTGWTVYLALPAFFPFLRAYTEDITSAIFYLAVGATLCVVASQTQRARLRAEQLANRLRTSEQDAAERAGQLEAVYEAMVDGVILYDSVGHIVRMNAAYRRMLALDLDSSHVLLTPEQRGQSLHIRDEKGQLLRADQMPVQRALGGEVFTSTNSMDIRVHALDGRDVQLNITGSPLYDHMGNLTGGVLIFRDVTERRSLERKTQQALTSLLSLAEELVQTPVSDSSLSSSRPSASTTIAYRLLEHIGLITGSTRSGLTLVDQATSTVFPVAAIGLSADMQQKWLEQRQDYSVEQLLQNPVIGSILRTRDIGILDYTQPPLSSAVNTFGISQAAVAPMYIEDRLVGFLFADHGGEPHTYAKSELALLKAVSELTVLVLERERLVADQAEAQANILAAREANAMMEEFLGIAGHELRTPLTTIKASVQLAQRQTLRLASRSRSLDPQLLQGINAVRDLLNRTERQIGTQSRLINDLLDVSRIQIGHLDLQPDLQDLALLVRQVVEDQRLLNPDRRIELDLPATRELLAIVDTDRIRQVVSNYLSNALKYSEADQPVSVQVTHDIPSKIVRVAVSDSGPGLTEAQQQRIWERFYRVPGIDVRTGSGVGLGLGLHISKMIIERLDGSVGIDSAPGQGSTFWFTLPLEAVLDK
ncbi:ATP-binding protein [Dictyobacter aurantiacus]|uniref:histidine kinase n=1 Tax=Dictyobacter aurantiacus TaxID=1936993 RepID=A0A401ZNS6_9CHLR|nr:ATP-binding protein [Dictyobacter aurantiacus]GCE08537.1 hypothetical protein KDAU_58660 [Dictyobacter aurantiacus]